MPQFQPGQVWTYQHRPGEEGSRLTVLLVEPQPNLGSIIHIRLEGLTVKNPSAPDGVARAIAHLPYAEASLASCVGQLEQGHAAVPEFEDGYRAWKTAFAQGKAGVWTMPLAQCVETMEKILSQQPAPRR